MNVLVIINNFNYGRYLDECIGSVMAQTRMADRVIVVDDGSIDDSMKVIQNWLGRDPRIVLIRKKNGGQLSCFNAATPYVQRDDIVFLLDADDAYPPDYIETVLAQHQSDVDMVFAENRLFGPSIGEPIQSCCPSGLGRVVTIPKSSNVTYLWSGWMGRPTSGISLRGALYRKLLPYDDEQSWKICADNVFVHGCSLLGGTKRFLLDISYNYRVHGANHWYGKPDDDRGEERRAAEHRLVLAMTRSADAPTLTSGWMGLRLAALRECLVVPWRVRRKVGLPHLHWLLLLPLYVQARSLRRFLRGRNVRLVRRVVRP